MCMTEFVAAPPPLTVHGSSSFLADVDRLLDPSGLVPYYLLCNEPDEEVIFILLMKTETSRYIIFLVVSKEVLYV